MVSVPEQYRELLRTQPYNSFASVLINNGRAFAVSDRFSDLGNGGTVDLFIDNPADSGYDYDAVLRPRATGLLDLDISFNATEDTQGAEATAENLKSSSSRTFSGDARKTETDTTGAYSHGDTFIEDIIPGGGRGVSIGGGYIDAISFTIDEGDNKLVRITNSSGGNLDRMAINALVFEVDGTFKEVPET